jgi:hypothetical protein
MLAYHNRLSYDDIYYLQLSKNYGAAGGMLFQYDHYAGRWSAHLLACFLLEHYSHPVQLFISTLISFGFFCFSVFYFFGKLQNNFWTENKINGWRVLIGSTTVCLFFSSFNTGDNWFWHISVFSYVWSVACAFITLAILLNPRLRLYDFPILLLCCVYIGGAAESFSLTAIFFLGVFYFSPRLFSMESLRPSQKIVAVLCVAVILISFIPVYLAPGNENRMSFLPHLSLSQKILLHFKINGIFWLKMTAKKIPLLVLFSLPWFLVGTEKHRSLRFNFRRHIVYPSLMLGALVFIFLLPTSYTLCDIPPPRALLWINILLVAYFSFISYIAGTQLKLNDALSGKIKITFTVLATLLIVSIVVQQQKIVSNYSEKYDERRQELESKDKKNVLERDSFGSLPPAGMLYWK